MMHMHTILHEKGPACYRRDVVLLPKMPSKILEDQYKRQIKLILLHFTSAVLTKLPEQAGEKKWKAAVISSLSLIFQFFKYILSKIALIPFSFCGVTEPFQNYLLKSKPAVSAFQALETYSELYSAIKVWNHWVVSDLSLCCVEDWKQKQKSSLLSQQFL